MKYPVTPDGRYFVVKERLWRCSNPNLSDAEREAFVKDLMRARTGVKNAAMPEDLKRARVEVNKAKVQLGERGPVWWTDGAPDVNRFHPKNTQYADWWAGLKGKKAR